MKCPKCKSENVNIQREESGAKTNSKTNYYSTQKSHGLSYWLLIGWWVWIFKICFLPFTMLFGKKKNINAGKSKISGKTQNIYSTIAICQNCGHTWEIK